MPSLITYLDCNAGGKTKVNTLLGTFPNVKPLGVARERRGTALCAAFPYRGAFDFLFEKERGPISKDFRRFVCSLIKKGKHV